MICAALESTPSPLKTLVLRFNVAVTPVVPLIKLIAFTTFVSSVVIDVPVVVIPAVGVPLMMIVPVVPAGPCVAGAPSRLLTTCCEVLPAVKPRLNTCHSARHWHALQHSSYT